MAQTKAIIFNLLLLLLCLCIQNTEGFKHKNYCGTICKLGQCARVKVHVHEQEKLHIQVKGVLDVDKDFRIYKKEGTRFFIRICTETGLLCKEEYEMHDYEDKINIKIKMPVYMLGDVNEDLLPCQMNIGSQ